MRLAVLVLILAIVSLVAGFTGPVAADPEGPAEARRPEPPPAGTFRFSASAKAFPKDAKPVFESGSTIYGLVGFGGPFRDLLAKADKSTNVVLKLFEGERQLAHHLFFPPVSSFDEVMLVTDIVPDPAHTAHSDFNHKFARALAGLDPGKHVLKVVLWSFHARKNDLASGSFTFVATEDGSAKLLEMADKIQEAKRRPKPAEPKPEPKPTVNVRHEGADFLQIRGDEIVKDGAVVGNFDGNVVRRGGSIVGEIRGKVFRHEGADAWSLDQGNLYSGIEIRWEGAIIGSIEKSGRITWEGSEWGRVAPYGGTPAETMRVFAALYYFSDYFRKQ